MPHDPTRRRAEEIVGQPGLVRGDHNAIDTMFLGIFDNFVRRATVPDDRFDLGHSTDLNPERFHCGVARANSRVVGKIRWHIARQRLDSSKRRDFRARVVGQFPRRRQRPFLAFFMGWVYSDEYIIEHRVLQLPATREHDDGRLNFDFDQVALIWPKSRSIGISAWPAPS